MMSRTDNFRFKGVIFWGDLIMPDDLSMPGIHALRKHFLLTLGFQEFQYRLTDCLFSKRFNPIPAFLSFRDFMGNIRH
jgi:hypothetical protein